MNLFLRYLADKQSAHRHTDTHTPMTTRPCGLRRAGKYTASLNAIITHCYWYQCYYRQKSGNGTPGRSQQCKVNGVLSDAINSRLSIVQGSGIGPMVFSQPRITYFHLPPAVGDIEQVNCFKLLGLIFQSNLKMDSHVHYIIIDVETRDLQIWLPRLCMAVRAMAVHRLMSWVLWTDE